MDRIQTSEQGETGESGKPVDPVAVDSNLIYVASQDPPMSQTTENHSIGNPWTTGLFDCHEHQTNAIMTAIFPCVTFGQMAEIMDNGEMSCHLGSFIYLLMMPALCSQWIMGSKYRTKLRKKYNLVEAPYEDLISHIFCPCCSLCQEFRELKNSGLDPSLGWNGILAQQQGRLDLNQDQSKTAAESDHVEIIDLSFVDTCYVVI